MIPVALYPRVSSQEQATNGYSIGEQIERMKKYCEAMNWTAYKIYTDAGYSGATTDRPGLQEMIRDVQAGRVMKVLVYKLDRLSRSQKDTLYLIEDVFLAHHVDFVSMCENFDTSTPFGRAMVGILAVFAQLEREQIKERMAMGREARAKEGLYNGGRNVPIGYTYTGGQLIPEPYEAMQVREAFELAADGVSVKGIEKVFAEKGYRHRYGPWRENTIRNVLNNRLYIGVMKYSGQYHKGQHEPIITETLFNDAAAILSARAEQYRRYNRRAGKATSYLGGFLVCGCCGAKYAKATTISTQTRATGIVKKYRYEWYACNSQTRRANYLVKDPNCTNRKWKVDELDAAIFGEIRKLTIDPGEPEPEAPKQDDRRKIIEAEMKKTDAKISRLLDLYADGKTPIDVLQEKIDDLQTRRAALAGELDDIDAADADLLSREEAAEKVATFDEILDNASFEEIRAVLSDLIRYIELDGEEIRIFWNFS